MALSIRFRFITGLALGSALCFAPAFAQKGGQAPPPSQPPAGGNVPSTPTPQPSPGPQPFPGSRDQNRSPFPGQDQRSPFPEMQRPIFLSGKVMMDDGTPPPDSVVIERVCNGNPRPEAYTDSKGRFSFQLGQNNAVMQDASYGSASDPGFGRTGSMGGPNPMGNPRGGVSERDLMGCELRASLPGYRSDIVNLSNRRAFDDPNVGTIVLHRMGNVEGTTISATTLQAPKDAKKAFEKGRKAAGKKKWDDATKELEKAVTAYPKYAIAWYELGSVQQQQNQFDQARKSYEQALAADPKYITPYLQLAFLSARENKWKEVAETTDRALQLNPFDFPQAYFYNSVANYNLRNLDAAEKSARQAEKLDTGHHFPKITHLLGIILAEKRDYSGAAEQMRAYLKFAPTAQDAPTVKSQLAEIEKMAGSNAKSAPQQ